MIETLEFRMKRMASYLAEEHAERPRKWWEDDTEKYITTAAKARENIYPPQRQELEILYDLKGALKSGALFILITSASYLYYWLRREELNMGNWVFVTLLTLGLAWCDLPRKLKNKVELVIGKNGLYIPP